jgi:hypothetical protein
MRDSVLGWDENRADLRVLEMPSDENASYDRQNPFAPFIHVLQLSMFAICSPIDGAGTAGSRSSYFRSWRISKIARNRLFGS